jgi:predicted GNAT superfamily acetyltransferase
MEIKQKLPENVNSIDVGLGQKETIPSHILTAHQEVGGILEGNINEKEAVTLFTPNLSQEKAISLNWKGINSELGDDERQKLNKGAEKFIEDNYGFEEVQFVPEEHNPEYQDTQDVMAEAWSDTGIGESEIIPTFEFAAKDKGENLLEKELDGIRAFVYGFPDMTSEESVYLHAVGAEEPRKGLGAEIMRDYREKVMREGFEKINWTVDPLKPAVNRLYTTKIGGIATEYKEDVYNTETSGETPADRFMIEWSINSDRTEDKINGLDSDERSYVRNLTQSDVEMALISGEEKPDYQNSKVKKLGEKEYEVGDVSRDLVGVELPETPVENMGDELGKINEEEWRYATRNVLSNLMSEGYQVKELMTAGENGFDANTYILEKN